MSKRSIGVFVAALVLLTSCSGGDRPELQAEIGSPVDLAFTDDRVDVSDDVTTEGVNDQVGGPDIETQSGAEPDGDRPDGVQVDGDGVVVPAELGDGLPYGSDPVLDQLYDNCRLHLLGDCDAMYLSSSAGSAYEALAVVCGGLGGEHYGTCVADFGSAARDRSLAIEDLTETYRIVSSFGDDPELDTLWMACDAEDDGACDELFFSSPVGSGYEAFARSCGGRRTSSSGGCHVGSDPVPVATTPPGRAGDGYGDNPGFDALWDACDGGIHDACDDLWGMSPLGSGYEAFASTCGNTTVATDGGCSEQLGGSAGDDFFAQHYGDDPGLDVVHDACRAGGGAACDLLYDMSPIDSDFERFALTCGDRRALAFTACA
jgi:hypothetical protein